MKIYSIKIENFRGIDKFDKKFVNPMTDEPLDIVVLTGPNGCGKTSILEGIVTTLTQKKTKDDKVFSKRNERHGKPFSIMIKLLDERNEYNIHYSTPKPNEPLRINTEYTDRVEYFSSWREPILKGALSVTLGKKGNRPQDVEANRLWNLKQFLIDSFVADNLPNDVKYKNTSHKSAISQIKKALAHFYLGSDIEIKINRVSADISDGFDVYLKYPNSGNNYISLDELSSGEIELFSFLSTIIRKDLTGGILLIDEPELHLHVSWHRVILNALRELLPKTQIICATHSLDIIESVKSYERLVIKSDEDYKNGTVSAANE
ncbi:MAG: AAA family ATPase [Candidatus Cloacimonas sp.]|jgi:predicted ATP-dependent endonuclease of OLD family|nr:AAA family ATPase [Candidatus Cloacimonas sp.]